VTHQPSTAREIDRRILHLAWPALGALIAEPVFVLIDSAVVGHLGRAPLAGLSLASNVLISVVSIFIFLAYATTAAVSRYQGAGKVREGINLGVDGMWLALILGLVITIPGMIFAPNVVQLLGASPDVLPHATAYLRTSIPGTTGMLLVFAATGTLRGLQDTRTPFIAAVVGAIANTIGSITFVYPLGMGIAGSGLATALTQIGMGTWLVYKVFDGGRNLGGINLKPHFGGIWHAAQAGIPLFIRTLTLRAAVIITVVVATSLGDIALAAHQIVNSMWGLTSFALDALAIAAQALIGSGLGGADPGLVRQYTRRALMWGVVAGSGIGFLIAISGFGITPLFTSDPQVQHAATWALVVCGVVMPIAGWVFVLDGVLIGAGDGRFLAVAGVTTLVAYLPLVGAVWAWAPADTIGLVWLWIGFGCGYMLARAITLGVRASGEKWIVLGI